MQMAGEHALQPAGQKDGSGAAKKAVATQSRPSKFDKELFIF